MIRIRLISSDYRILSEFAEEVKKIALKMGLKYSGPIELPTREVIIPYKRRLDKVTWNMLRIMLYKCLFNVDGDERFMRRLSMVDIPDEVFMNIKVK